MTSVRLAGNNFIIKFNIFIFLYFYEKCRVSYVVRTETITTVSYHRHRTVPRVYRPGYRVVVQYCVLYGMLYVILYVVRCTAVSNGRTTTIFINSTCVHTAVL
jgi:hypothetical protein